MKARLINDGSLKVLCSNGTILENPNKDQLYFFLSNFKRVAEIKGDINKKWSNEYPDMSMRKGNTLAYITDSLQLVIEDFSPFISLIEGKESITIDDMLTIPEYAAKVGKSVEQIKIYARSNRLTGAQKIGRDWLIPRDCVLPKDRRKKEIRRLDGRSSID